ncbi:MAG TPA: ABC transporter ATP-binding protein [Clostridia bacterium]|nr:MAG: Oligopeptide transport ATP-binding protein OppF [Firmicutes bacterium ADurb.Bin248]HOG01201.1 ABC transporter ATP-binding protein [Clostridia bacterium]HOS18404.1 ABC transporter ATP-binding protein [Clostridia bacterium]HPK15086.1 ABC transporter ATP-binding protein [Clostridia bacterium]
MSAPLVSVKDLKVHFEVRGGLFSPQKTVRAVDGVSFDIGRGEILSLVGESGSGKTTTGKAILRLVGATAGEVRFEGEPVSRKNSELHEFRKKAQMIYQDPYQSLNPREYVVDIVAEPLDVNGLVDTAAQREERVKQALAAAGLQPPEDFLYRYPYELSGGQRQRAALASSLILDPAFVVADEPVSMLDASIRTGIVKLMLKQRDERGIAYLFITHDLSLAWLISDRIAIMYLGRIMETGNADVIIRRGLHPYTRALVGIMPVPGVERAGKRNLLAGDIPSAASFIPGCKFASRCPTAQEICRAECPELVEAEPGHSVACHFVKGA